MTVCRDANELPNDVLERANSHTQGQADRVLRATSPVKHISPRSVHLGKRSAYAGRQALTNGVVVEIWVRDAEHLPSVLQGLDQPCIALAERLVGREQAPHRRRLEARPCASESVRLRQGFEQQQQQQQNDGDSRVRGGEKKG